MGGDTHTRSAANNYPKFAAGPVGQQIHNIYRDRLGQFTGGGQYEGQNLRGALYEGRASGEQHVKLSVYSPHNLARPTFQDATKNEFKPTKIGESFGPSWSTHWFKIQVKVPTNLAQKELLEFHWDANNEGLVWSEDGEPLQGLTGGGERTEWMLPKEFRDSEEHIFYIEMACNGMFGNAGGDIIQPPNPERYFQLSTADIVAVNVEARALYVDFWEIGDAAREFPGDSWESHEALQVGNAIMDAFIAGHGSQKSILKGREIARKYIGARANSHEVYETDEKAIVFAIGHCHIDTCWLWPWAETKRKVARSWANQCNLMDRYPEHRFACSQAQQYKWLEQLYPALYDRVKAHVKKGAFQPIGGSWVEHDTNMPSGESLVRQFLYGQRFFEGHFGERCQTFWLPDTFGYSSQLPQLCRLAGMSRFFTQKLSWNNINNFPHTTFNWVALDGSQVLCHMAPSETYTADANFGDVKRSVTQHKSMDQDKTSLLVFGKGDGGGGPTFQHLDKLRRCRGISDTVGLLPRVHMGSSVDDFFLALEKKAESGTKFVTWYGELYFELHRGTYTTQANNKWNNRKTEILLHDVEYLATHATLASSSYKYPKKEIDGMWEDVLLCQFHDCLPGSSIEMCYDDSDELYAHVFETGEKLVKDAMAVLGYSKHETGNVSSIALNTLPWRREEILKIPGESQYALVRGSQGPAEVRVLGKSTKELATVQEIKAGLFLLSNDQFDLHIEGGSIVSLIDKKANREIVAKGQKVNQLVIFDDKPLYWQAWDVEVFHLDSREVLPAGNTLIAENSPHRVGVVTETKISENSWAKTTISLSAVVEGQQSMIEVDCEVEWRENMKFLKVEFPVNIYNTEASYETQYGIIKRPTHYNTSWDMAKFEVCCHKWADLSENGYGVSILNDSKYGFATCGNMMRLSLLRAPKAPDAHADMGRHHIRYAILPHAGPLDHRTVRSAHNFNHPMQLYTSTTGKTPDSSKLLNAIRTKGSNSLILDCVKRGEDDEDVSRGELPKRKSRSIILRVYESLGGTSRGSFHVDDRLIKVKKVFKTNILEDDETELTIKNGVVEIELRPFEVATYRLQL
ncbi:Glycoside hydrolase, 38 vacuolar alpha mannosidase [Xylographa parallela]|nr:Glycoside hydrolase, 38 vacuolar alpha mannosidase [Xylographa parallela]